MAGCYDFLCHYYYSAKYSMDFLGYCGDTMGIPWCRDSRGNPGLGRILVISRDLSSDMVGILWDSVEHTVRIVG